MDEPIPHLILGLWVAWAAYWWAASRGTKSIRRHESVVSRAAHLGPIALAAILLAVRSAPGWLGLRWLPLSPVTYWIGVGLVIVGLGFTVWARVVLGGNWSATVTVKHDHEIVRSGPYRWLRHPIYTGLLLAFVGCAVALGEWRGIVAVAIVWAALWRKLRLEERWLTEEFGTRYSDYRRETWALIPFVL